MHHLLHCSLLTCLYLELASVNEKKLYVVSSCSSSSLGELPYGKSAVASGIESLAAHIKAGNRLAQPLNCSDQL